MPHASHAITHLTLENFRNYASLSLDIPARPVVLTGHNGAGKTNILEAISLLSPGRGLRNARLRGIDREGAPWVVASEVLHRGETHRIGTGRDAESTAEKRILKINGQRERKQAVLTQYIAVQWLTPSLDQVFVEGGSARRKLLDRLTYGFDPEHAARVTAYESAMRERNRLLAQGRGSDPYWLSVLEQQMAEHAVAITLARLDAVERIRAAILPPAGGGPNPPMRIWGGGQKLGQTDESSRHPPTMEHAEELRKNPTEAEKKLWAALQGRQLDGYTFCCQHPVGDYIVDFVCMQKNLIIELDGGQHASRMEYDAVRTEYLNSRGYRVMRFWNNEVLENLEGVVATIAQAATHPPVAGDARSAPRQRGEAFFDAFTRFSLTLDGAIERWLGEGVSALDVETQFAERLKDLRALDVLSGRTSEGPHRSGLEVIHILKSRMAEDCSTGEQKAILLAIVIAACMGRAEWCGAAPILLLDEVVAHLDVDKRAALFDLLRTARVQAWMTGTDAADFSGLEGFATHLEIAGGTVVGRVEI